MKTQGYKKFYHEIWMDRSIEDMEGAVYARCEYLDCGKTIYEMQVAVHNFAHILSKGSTPEKKFDKNNVAIWCAQHHFEDHASGKVTNYLPLK